MFLDRFFRPRVTLAMGQKLYAGVVAQARTPALYELYGVPDTVEGRFELYTAHVFLLLDRLRGQGSRASETSQALFDTYLGALDDALREMGVGDLSVGKKMRRLGEAFYGRVKSYEAAFAALPQTDHLQALLTRTVYAQGGAENVGKLADYVLKQRAALAEQKLDALLDGRAVWSQA
ncbi:MAG: ubiquinol-cytochrome C reductase [Phenylobacterium sp. SCN 69-14]|nr:MAG: ubiquinol-cytochrome C reductase [Phenylobacterium sp. SCN 69-14]